MVSYTVIDNYNISLCIFIVYIRIINTVIALYLGLFFSLLFFLLRLLSLYFQWFPSKSSQLNPTQIKSIN